MPISKTRLFRKAPRDPRYNNFPEAYQEFIDSIPPDYRIHVMPEADGGNDLTGDGSLDAPYANVDYAINSIPFTERSPLKPYTKWGVIVFPGEYITMGHNNPDASKYPDFRVSAFTDYFVNPLNVIPEDKRYTIDVQRTEYTDRKGNVRIREKVTKTDNYKGHAFLTDKNWFYEMHVIGAAGNTKIYYKTFPDYYDPETRKYRNNEAIAGKGKLAYLGLWPSFYTYDSITKTYSGGRQRHEQGIEFNLAQDGDYTVKYYIDVRNRDNTFYTVPGLEGGAFITGLNFDERYNYYYIDSDDSNPSAILANADYGNVQIVGSANIDLNHGKFGGSLRLNSKGGALLPVDKINFAIGTRDFTAEAWIFAGAKGDTAPIFDYTSTRRKFYGFSFGLKSKKLSATLHKSNSNKSNDKTTSESNEIESDAWNHVGIQRSGNKVFILYNGGVAHTFDTVAGYRKQNSSYYYVPETYDIAAEDTSVYLGLRQAASSESSGPGSGSPSYYISGGNIWIDEPRITLGNSRYTFSTANVPAVNLTVLDNTVALYSMTTAIFDSGPFNYALKTEGGQLLSNYTPFDESANTYSSTLFTAGNFLSIPATSTLDLGTDFTIDFWLFNSSLQPRNSSYMFNRGASTLGQKSYSIVFSPSYGPYVNLSTNGTTYNLLNNYRGFTTIIKNKWSHYAISREGTNLRFYLNGKLVNTRVLASSDPLFVSSADIRMNTLTGSNGSFQFIVYGFRVRNVSFSDSTIAVPESSSAYDSPDSSVLFQLGQSGTDPVDQSQNSLAVNNYFKTTSNTGNVFGLPVTPFGISAEGDSTYIYAGKRLTDPNNKSQKLPRVQSLIVIPSELTETITNSQFTLEFFFKLNTVENGGGGTGLSYNKAILLSNSTNGILKNGEFEIELDRNNLSFRYRKPPYPSNKDGIPTTSGQTLSFLTGIVGASFADWNHVAMVQDNEYTRLYFNGLQTANVRSLLNVGYTSSKEEPIELINNGFVLGRIAATLNNAYLDTQINSLRLSANAIYTNSFNLDLTSPFEALPETTLLTFNRQDSFSDYTTVGDIGNYKDSPFYTTTAQGSNFIFYSKLITPSAYVADLDGDFTIEAWFYKYTPWLQNETVLGIKGPRGRLSLSYNLTNNVSGFILNYPLVSKTTGETIGTGFQTFEANLPVREWAHIAMSRKGTILNVFVNGNLVFSRIGIKFSEPRVQVMVGTNGTSGYFVGLIKDFRVSNEPVYFSGYDVPETPFSLDPADDVHASNVRLLSHFDNEYYRRKYALNASEADSKGLGNLGQTINLAAGVHTINVSAIAHRYQNSFGFDMIDNKNKIVLESRRDARDNNLGYFRHPNSSVRGVHVIYTAAKLFHYQNALFSTPKRNLRNSYIGQRETQKNKYDPFAPEYRIKRGATRTIAVGKGASRTTTTVTGKQTQEGSFHYGNYYNVGVEGIDFSIIHKEEGEKIRMEYCTFRYPKVGFDPAANSNASTSVGYFGSGNTLISNSVFGTNRDDMKSVFTRPYNRLTAPKDYNFKEVKDKEGKSLGTKIPSLINPIFNAVIQANTLTVTSVSLPPLTKITGVRFNSTAQTSTNLAGYTRPANPQYTNGATTGTNILNPTGTNYSLILPSKPFGNVSDTFAGVNLNTAIIPNSDFWKLSFYLYHNGNMAGTTIGWPEMLFFIGGYVPVSLKNYLAAKTLPNSWEIIIKPAFGATLTKPGIGLVSTRQYFGLELRRMGTPWKGPNDKYRLASNLLYFAVNTWYKIDIVFEKYFLRVLANNVLVMDDDFSSYTSRLGKTLPFPANGFNFTDQSSSWVGVPNNHYSKFSSLATRNFSGYMQDIITTSGTDVSVGNLGVYAGKYKWILES